LIDTEFSQIKGNNGFIDSSRDSASLERRNNLRAGCISKVVRHISTILVEPPYQAGGQKVQQWSAQSKQINFQPP
jgi:hypothetical protein